MRRLLLVLCTVVFALSTTAFVLSYAAISSVNPSTVMGLAEEAGGTESLVDKALEKLIVVDDPALRLKVIEAAKAALPETTLRDLTAQVLAGIRRYLDSAGTERTILIDLRDVKAEFMDELKKTYKGSLDDIEVDLERIPDRANLIDFMPVSNVREISRPYSVISKLPLTSLAIAAAAAVLIFLSGGLSPGLRVIGYSAIAASVVVIAVTLVLPSMLENRIADAVRLTNMDVSLPVDTPALIGRLLTSVLGRLRIVAAVAGVCGTALAYISRMANWGHTGAQ